MYSKILCLIVGFVVLQGSTWKVDLIKGEAFVLRSGVEVNLKEREVLKPGDKVITKKKSKMKLIKGDSKIWLGQNTKFIIPSSKKPNEKASFFKLLRGKIRAKVKPGTEKNFKIETSTAVAGVRGTEFFVQAEEDKGFVCTISGKVSVTKKESKKNIEVPMCAGVSVSKAESMELKPTPSHLVNKWIAETSIENNNPIVNDTYDFQNSPIHHFLGNWHYSNKVFLNAISLDKTDYFNSSSNTTSNSINYLRYSPSIIYSGNFRFKLQARYYLGASAEDFPFIKSGSRVKTINALRLGEAYFEKQDSAINYKLGLQPVKWGAGELLSRDFWGVDGYLYPGLRVSGAISENYYFDFIAAAKGSEDDLSGQVPVSLLGLKIDFRAWSRMFLLVRDFEPKTKFAGQVLFDNHKALDFGFESGHKMLRWDYKVFYILQSNDSFRESTNKNMKENSLGFDYGYYPYPNKNMRFGIAFNRASESYLPGFESPYLLGYSQLLKRSNLQQFRFKFSYSWNENWTLMMEQIKNTSLNSGEFSSWTGKDKDLLDEIDIGFLYSKSESNLNALIAIYSTNPKYAWKNSGSWASTERGYGFILNVQKSF